MIASDITLRDINNFSGSLRLRFFGPRDLTSDGIYRSKTTALLNGEIGYRIHENWGISAEFLNLLSRRDHDIDYAYESEVTPTTMPVFRDRRTGSGAILDKKNLLTKAAVVGSRQRLDHEGAFNVLKDNHARP